jgi:hypothetical protein
MGRDETILAAAIPVYQVDNSFQGRFVAGSWPVEDMLEQVSGRQVAEDNRKYGQNNHYPCPLSIMLKQKISEKSIKWDPDPFIRSPEHKEIEECRMGTVDGKEKISID